MNRRRFIKIAAAALPCAVWAKDAFGFMSAGLKPYRWDGYLLGAEGGFTLYGDDAEKARRVMDVCFKEIKRLESIFTLYQEDSALRRLNRDGVLRNPPRELLDVLQYATEAHEACMGKFDPTVQPLWELYSNHFKKHPDATDGPGRDAIADALEVTGFHKVEFDESEVRLRRAGMALTLNGIAQGFITDRVSDILRGEGYGHVLVELGETRAIGKHPEGRAFRIGIRDAGGNGLYDTVELDDRALATSGAYGTWFSSDGRYNHLIDPHSGRAAPCKVSVSVLAPTATQADAFSTGLCHLSESEREVFLSGHRGVEVIVQG